MYGNVLDTILLTMVMIGVFLTVTLETLLLSKNKITNWEKAVLVLVVVLIILTIILW